jgi:hypothetical protein
MRRAICALARTPQPGSPSIGQAGQSGSRRGLNAPSVNPLCNSGLQRIGVRAKARARRCNIVERNE